MIHRHFGWCVVIWATNQPGDSQLGDISLNGRMYCHLSAITTQSRWIGWRAMGSVLVIHHWPAAACQVSRPWSPMTPVWVLPEFVVSVVAVATVVVSIYCCCYIKVLQRETHLRRWLQLRFDRRSTPIRLQIRPRYDHSTTYVTITAA